MSLPHVHLRSLHAEPLSVPLREPFVIASGRIDATRAALVTVTLSATHDGRVVTGLGEAAALPPVTHEDQPDILAALARTAVQLAGVRLTDLTELSAALDAALSGMPVARAGVESALLDAWARLAAVPVCGLLRAKPPLTLVTDITLPIGEPEHMAELAAAWRSRGFRVFKVKVGKQLDNDVRALHAVHARVPDARFRLDANGGYEAAQALELVRDARARGLHLECFEQPCARDDLAGMAQVTREAGVPVIADESVRTLGDLEQILTARAAHGVNLKLVKSGGLLAALAIGERARSQGLQIMCGGMVETRLGLTAMAHVCAALGAVDYVDLDTALLLAADPFRGGYRDSGAELTLNDATGLDIERAS